MAVTWKRLAYDDEVILKTFMAAKGDLISASANDTPVVLGIGNAGDILKVGGAGASGLIWEAPGVVNHDMFSATHQDTSGVASVVSW